MEFYLGQPTIKISISVITARHRVMIDGFRPV